MTSNFHDGGHDVIAAVTSCH